MATKIHNFLLHSGIATCVLSFFISRVYIIVECGFAENFIMHSLRERQTGGSHCGAYDHVVE